MAPEHVIVGLGNPGPEHVDTPHNIGWEVLDALWGRGRFAPWESFRGRALVAEGRLRGHQVVLARPTTYMNLSGDAVAPLLAAHGVDAARLLVVSDDIALPLGRLRLRPGGSAGGHRGLQSIIDAIDSAEFARLRVGVAPEDGLPCAAERWVLSKWSPANRAHADALVAAAVACVEALVTQGLERAMALHNGRRVPPPGETGAPQAGVSPPRPETV